VHTLVGSRRVHYHQIKPLSLYLGFYYLYHFNFQRPFFSTQTSLLFFASTKVINSTLFSQLLFFVRINSQRLFAFSLINLVLRSVSKFKSMASAQLTAIASSVSTTSFERLRPSTFQMGRVRIGNLPQRSFRGLVVKAATVVAPKVFSSNSYFCRMHYL